MAVVYRERQGACPRCGTRLDPERSGELAFSRCASCRGVWMEESTFNAMLVEMGSPVDALPAAASDEPPLTCSYCAKPMRKVRLYTILLDHCERDGLWFDSAELQKTLAGSAGLPVDPTTPLDERVTLLQQVLSSPPKKA